MACFHPNVIFVHPQSRERRFLGPLDTFLKFYGCKDASELNRFFYEVVPCGKCLSCHLERSRQWAIRCVHEAQLHENNCFITLTVAPENMEDVFPHSSLAIRPYQLFMKKLRKRAGQNIRFFQCGEYGSQLERPHYHACLFNFDFHDKELWTVRNGVKLYRSRFLESLWPYGFCTVGDVTFESAAYIARYVVKKINGDKSAEHYGDRHPEYITMSRRPGLAAGWFQKYKGDVYPNDEVIVKGHKCRPPRYYDKLYDLEDSRSMARIKAEREERALAHSNDNTPERLAVREVVLHARCKKLIRSYENEKI